VSFLVREDEALKALLQGIEVSDEKDQTRPVGVWFANPDVEIRQQQYPYLTIELIGVNWASYRQHSGIWVDNDRQGTEVPVNGQVYEYQMPVTWDLMYQITSYARHPRHDRAIIAYLLNGKFRAKTSFLPVLNELGTESAWRHISLEGFAKRDMVEDGRKLFRNVFTVLVTSESVPVDGSSTGQVQNVLINDDPNYIPDELLQP
jgi:hypothetical protein